MGGSAPFYPACSFSHPAGERGDNPSPLSRSFLFLLCHHRHPDRIPRLPAGQAGKNRSRGQIRLFFSIPQSTSPLLPMVRPVALTSLRGYVRLRLRRRAGNVFSMPASNSDSVRSSVCVIVSTKTMRSVTLCSPRSIPPMYVRCRPHSSAKDS